MQIAKVLNIRGTIHAVIVEVLNAGEYHSLNDFNAANNTRLKAVTKAKLGGTSRHVGIFDVLSNVIPEPAFQIVESENTDAESTVE